MTQQTTKKSSRDHEMEAIQRRHLEQRRRLDEAHAELYRSGDSRARTSVRMDKSTNWNSDPRMKGTRRVGQPSLMGEGLGNCLGLEGAKYFQSQSPDNSVDTDSAAVEAREAEDKARRRAEGTAKAAVTRAKNAERRARLSEKEERGDILKNQRVFVCEWGYDDFDKRAQCASGMPEGVDVAKTEFATLLLIQVVERDEGKALGWEAPLKDLHGREFFVPVSRREHIEQVFGRVNWGRPLPESEVKQFGIDIL